MFSKPSPRLPRKEHQQITGSEADEKDRIIAGVQFFVHYIGSTDVAYANGTGSGNTENPVAQVFDKLRREVNGKPQEKMVLTLCSKSLSVIDKACGKLVASFPIDKITFCNTDKFYEKAFVFVARDKPENPFKAFVFTCESKSKAKEAFQALSLAFIINYEWYQASLARGASNGHETTAGKCSPCERAERNNTSFDGDEDGYKMKSTEVYPESEQLHCNGVMVSPKEFSEHDVDVIQLKSSQEAPPPLTRPVQNKILHEVAEDRTARAASDPTQFSRQTRAPVAIPSPLAAGAPQPQITAPNNSADTEMEEEFTEFAEVRSRWSSAAVVGNHHSNDWISFWDDCRPIN